MSCVCLNSNNDCLTLRVLLFPVTGIIFLDSQDTPPNNFFWWQLIVTVFSSLFYLNHSWVASSKPLLRNIVRFSKYEQRNFFQLLAGPSLKREN